MTEGKCKGASHTSRIVRGVGVLSAVATVIQGEKVSQHPIAGIARFLALPHPSVPQLHARWRSVAGPTPAARTDLVRQVH